MCTSTWSSTDCTMNSISGSCVISKMIFGRRCSVGKEANDSPGFRTWLAWLQLVQIRFYAPAL